MLSKQQHIDYWINTAEDDWDTVNVLYNGGNKRDTTMLTQTAVIDTVRNYASEVRNAGVNLKKVILFGSFAKGTQYEWSDIDVALVADDFSGVGFLDRPLFSRINIKKPYIRIEPKTYPTEYYQKSDPFIEEIKKTGIEII